MAARWNGMEDFRGLRDWCAREPGGAYPQKVDDQLKRYCREKGIEVPPYLQYEGLTPEEVVEAIDRTGRMACFTYGESPRYSSAINHMVCGVKYNGKYGVVLDNNFPGEDAYEWMSREELIHRMKVSANPRGRPVLGTAWVFVWLTPPPPPVPRN